VNGDVLVVGGLTDRNVDATTSSEIFDTSTGSWLPAGDLATPRAYHTATLLRDGRVLVVGGTEAEIWTPATTLAVSSALDVGTHAVGSTATSDVQVTNTGDQPLLLSDVAVGGDFALYGDGCRVAVYPGGTCAVGIRFTPTAPGPRSARLTFGDNTAGRSTPWY
jgi:hypothetical protein